MRSYASAYKICGEVSPAESQRDGPIALCALPDYRNQRYRTRSGSASGDWVSSYNKGARDDTDFRYAGDLVSGQECIFCGKADTAMASNSLAYAIQDAFPVTRFHTLII